MFKKMLFIAALMIFCINLQTNAQSQKGSSYDNAVGLGLDFGTGVTGAGGSFKHFFNTNSAGEVDLMFYNDLVSLGAFYEYHGTIKNAAGLKWYFGLGPQFFFAKGNTNIAARIPIGLDYKIPNVPLVFTFDWRPYYRFNNGSDFIAARFGLGIRFVL